MKTILIAPNSFKECANSVETASLIKKNFDDSQFNFIIKPLSDGGDGFLEISKENFNLKIVNYEIPKPYGDGKVSCPVGITPDEKTVYIESAKVLGMTMISPSERNPVLSNSRGLGVLLKKLGQQFPRMGKIIIGIGGTGTNDLGLGVAAEFGLKLLDSDKNELEIIPQNYIKARDIIWDGEKTFCNIELIVDVDNQLLGVEGATRIFASQKGASADDIEIMEAGFENIISILVKKKLQDETIKLNGAGGGLAAGLQIFFNAELKYSFDFILNDLGIKNISSENLIVITGEGKFDSQSLMNKAVGVVIKQFNNSGAQVFVICGVAEKGIQNKIPGNVKIIEMQKYFKSVDESIRHFSDGIYNAFREINLFLHEQ